MRTKTTLFLLVLVCALGGIAYYVHDTWRIRPDREQDSVLVDAASPDYLEIDFRDDAPSIVLQKQNDRWGLTRPVLWPANVFTIERLLTRLQFLKKETTFPVPAAGAEQALADYGLDPAEGTLVYGRGATRHTLHIGRPTDNGRNLYVLPDGDDRVFVVARALLDDLQRPLEDMRSDAVFEVRLFEVRDWSIKLAESGNTATRLVREGERWKFESPLPARADKAAVDVLLNQVLDLRVQSFRSEETSDVNLLGLASPAVRLTVVGSGGRREALLIGNPAPDAVGQYFAKLENKETVFTVRVPFLDSLRTAQSGLRDRRVVEFDRDRLEVLTIRPAGQPEFFLRKLETGAWQVLPRTADRALATMDGDRELIETLVQQTEQLRAVPDGGFVTDVPTVRDLETVYGLTGEPAWEIKMTERPASVGGSMRTQTLTLGRRPTEAGRTNLQYARGDGDTVYLVDRGLGDDLRSEPFRYRSRQLKQMAEGERITALTLQRLSNDEVVFSATRATADQKWAEVLAGEPEARREGALALIAQLRNLRARAIVAPEFGKSVPGGTEVRPWTWVLEATVALDGGLTPQTTRFALYLDAVTGGTELLVGVPDLGLVAAVEPAFIDSVWPLAFPRVDPGPVPPAAAPEETPPPAAPESAPTGA